MSRYTRSPKFEKWRKTTWSGNHIALNISLKSSFVCLRWSPALVVRETPALLRGLSDGVVKGTIHSFGTIIHVKFMLLDESAGYFCCTSRGLRRASGYRQCFVYIQLCIGRPRMLSVLSSWQQECGVQILQGYILVFCKIVRGINRSSGYSIQLPLMNVEDCFSYSYDVIHRSINQISGLWVFLKICEVA